MFRTTAVLFMLCLGNVIQAQDWDVQVINPNIRLTDVHALSANEAIVVGYEPLIDGAAFGYRTMDGGASWDTVFTINVGRLQEIKFINSQTGWIVGWEPDPLFQSPAVRVWKTNDGGLSWNSISQGLGMGQGFAIEMLSDTKGWVLGETNQLFETELYCLETGLTDWQSNCSQSGIDMNQFGAFRDLLFLNNDYGWIVAPPDSIYLTSNGGASWTARSLPAMVGSNLSMNFVDEQHGWLVDEAGTYLRTSDGGTNWTEEGSIGSLNDIQFLDINAGWSVGAGGRLQHTSDGGATWIQQAVTTQKLNALSFISADTGYVVGDEGIFLKTVTGGATGIKEGLSEAYPNSINLLPNYPNPFNPSTTLRFELQKRSTVLLQITDISGRYVRTLLRDVRSPGLHELEWDGRDDAGNPVASGVYLTRLESRGVVQSQKVLLIR